MAKAICLKMQHQQRQSTAKQMPSCFTHFYCHRLVLLTQKHFKFFPRLAAVSKRFGEIQPLKILSAARSFNLSGPQKNGPLAAGAISINGVADSNGTSFRLRSLHVRDRRASMQVIPRFNLLIPVVGAPRLRLGSVFILLA